MTIATTREEAVLNAINMRGQGVYGLGRGNGNHPERSSPLDSKGRCDCSNLVHWLIGSKLDRGSQGYYNTDGILYDAYGLLKRGGQSKPRERVFEAARGNVKPGDLIVRPGKFAVRDGKLKRLRAGHVALITQVLPEFRRSMPFRTEGYKLLRIVHCSTFGTKRPPAIRETNASAFRTTGYIVRYRWYATGV